MLDLHVFDNVFDDKVLNAYLKRITEHFAVQQQTGEVLQWHPHRNIRLDVQDPMVLEVKEFLQSKLRMRTSCYDVELQTWPIGSYSDLHCHDKTNYGRAGLGDYNSLLYLNDDFEGGEFFTEHGITIVPKKNRLTFFDGYRIAHGLRTVEKRNRHTLIFWWSNTMWL